MNLLETLLSSPALQQVAQRAGLGESDTRNAIGKLLPSVARGLQRNSADEGLLGNLLGALTKGNHQEYLDKPETLGRRQTIDDGNKILGHIFGSKDVSRNVAGHAAAQTGLDSGIMKKMLPMIASIAMGALSKKASGAGLLGAALNSGNSRSNLNLVSSFLDADKDGSVADDLLNLAKRFF